MARFKKPFEIRPPQISPAEPAQPAAQWWRPLMSRWGILGLLIFVGLVLRSIELVSGWFGSATR
jgi:hypothetical protein